MELALWISLILLIIAAVLKKREVSSKTTHNNAYEQEQPQQTSYSENINSNTYMPYRRKHLLTKTEYSFYKTLKNTCDIYNLHICPKVRLEDLAEVTTHKNNMKYRGYIKSRHVDFVLCDADLNIIAAIELDDYSHNTAKARSIDNFKNSLFQTIGIPLFRIVVCNNYEGQLHYMVTTLNLCKPVNTSSSSQVIPYDVDYNKLNELLTKQFDLLIEQKSLLNQFNNDVVDSRQNK